MSCCHGGHNHDDKDPKKQHKMHNWMMIVGCVLPIILLAALLFSGVDLGAWSTVLPILLILVCPLMHLVMMPLMMGGKKHRH